MHRSAFIDLYSDTKSKPTDGMRRYMMSVEVGDEQKDEDPNVLDLCARVADMLGKEEAVFLPSGTMCNEIALAVHCRPGDEIIVHESAHIMVSEGGGPAALAGVMVRGIRGENGIFDAQTLRRAIRPESRYLQQSRLVSVEQTANFGGGAIWPLATIQDIVAVAREAGLVLHMDGARLLNAVVASGVSAKDYAGPFDSAWIDLSKGLGGPVGGVLAGSRDFIRQAWRLKQRWGGAMRQAGFLAAAGIYALDHHVERLAEDHENARALAKGLAALPGIRLAAGEVQTNIVFFDVAGSGKSPAEIVAALKARDVGMGGGGLFGPTVMRAVTHIGVSRADIDTALGAMREALAA
ncbi:L-allo-threonine aldolase [Bosea sp. 62]|uniref:threonine aldolase family protein n=1 Tax=unclassified Bosea (in: a-proteobacteria) TaxID=2653178 RepID=UPI00125130DF|nr:MULTISPECIES: threonine aldolase family protein [unclassified Bosea (in: a-proteobacteria)]CAD5296046.1 L-allo-threonine aldolase [Bosea sp. 21B]CAD5296435.1 L-allo-threonine aldolase [Bosea sp. 46]CAD5297637.1 L-allo-threonine aldolase [Bosea sp. 7B]VVT61088.1 L-allo-threonine aldolase [Bosea sp. EC-HK365B]VXB14201.1 L-allo-threonine aldolase [Bosea sp. 125]